MGKKLFFTGLIFFIFHFTSGAQWEWARKITGPETQRLISISTDKSGNSFVAGYSSGEIKTEEIITDSGYYLMKFNRSGNAVFAKSLPAEISNVSCNDSGFVLISGLFSGKIFLDGFFIQSHGKKDVFVALLNPAGICIFAKSFGNAGEEGNVLSSVSDQEILISFTAENPVFRSFRLITLTRTGIEISEKEGLNGLVTGVHSGEKKTFFTIKQEGPEPLSYDTMQFSGDLEGKEFLFVTDSNLSYQRHREFAAESRLSQITEDDSGFVYTVFSTGSHLYYQPNLIKMDQDLKTVWFKPMGESTGTHILSGGLKFNSKGKLIITGASGNNMTLRDSIEIEGFTLFNSGGSDNLFAIIGRDGRIENLYSNGGRSNSMIFGAGIDEQDNIFVAGEYNHQTAEHPDRDTLIFGNDSLIADGDHPSIFIARFGEIPVISGNEENFSAGSMNVFPNPANHSFMITVPENGILEITSLSGDLILKTEMGKGLNEIRFEEPDGLYTGRFITTNREIFTFRVVLTGN